MSLFSPYVLIGIVLAVLASYGAGRAQQWHRDGVVYQKKVDQMVADAAAAKAQEEQRRLQEATAAEAAAAEKEKGRAKQLADAQRKVASLSAALAATRVADVARVLNDTISGDDPKPAGTAAKPREAAAAVAQSTDTTVGLWAQWSVTVIGLYNACADQVIGLQTFYGKLRGTPN